MLYFVKYKSDTSLQLSFSAFLSIHVVVEVEGGAMPLSPPKSVNNSPQLEHTIRYQDTLYRENYISDGVTVKSGEHLPPGSVT